MSKRKMHRVSTGLRQPDSTAVSFPSVSDQGEKALAACHRMQENTARVLKENRRLSEDKDRPAPPNDGSAIHRFQETGIEFIDIKLRVCETFILLALHQKGGVRHEYARNARKAYDSAVRYMGRIDCGRGEKPSFDRRLAQLEADAPWLASESGASVEKNECGTPEYISVRRFSL